MSGRLKSPTTMGTGVWAQNDIRMKTYTIRGDHVLSGTEKNSVYIKIYWLSRIRLLHNVMSLSLLIVHLLLFWLLTLTYIDSTFVPSGLLTCTDLPSWDWPLYACLCHTTQLAHARTTVYCIRLWQCKRQWLLLEGGTPGERRMR